MNTVQCVTHPTAGNSPIKSDVTKLDVTELRTIINYERGGEGDDQIDDTGSKDLAKGGPLAFRAATRSGQEHCGLRTETDIDLKLLLVDVVEEVEMVIEVEKVVYQFLE